MYDVQEAEEVLRSRICTAVEMEEKLLLELPVLTQRKERAHQDVLKVHAATHRRAHPAERNSGLVSATRGPRLSGSKKVADGAND